MSAEELPLLPGDPDAVLDAAAQLSVTAERLAATSDALWDVRTAGWASEAGYRFADAVGRVPAVLSAVARRYGEAAGVLRTYAEALEEAQRAAQTAGWRFESAKATVDALDVRLRSTTDESARYALEVQRAEWVPGLDAARVGWHTARTRLDEADARCAARLRTLGRDGIADPALYRALHRTQTVGSGLATVGLYPTPWTAWAAGIGGAAATGATVGLRLVYGEGSWRSIGVQAGLTAGGAGARVLKASSAVRRVVDDVPQPLTRGQRLGIGSKEQLWSKAPWRMPLQPSPVKEVPIHPKPVGDLRTRTTQRARWAAKDAVQDKFVKDWRKATLSGQGGHELLLASWGVGGATKATSKTRTWVQRYRDREEAADH